jgi:hypothetical protein
MADVKVKSQTKGMGPFKMLMGSYSEKAVGKHGSAYSSTKKGAVDNYNKKYGGKKK